MCFSAEASFIAAFVLIIIGVMTLRLKRGKGYTVLASIPLFFGIQQFSEGFVWYGLANGYSVLTTVAIYSFMFFAVVVWPVIIPAALVTIEKHAVRKKLIKIFLGLSIAWALIIGFFMIRFGISAEIIGNHIVYTVREQLTFVALDGLIYSALVYIPFFLTHIRAAWILAGLLVGAQIISAIFFSLAFASVWCFFAAILSTYIYYILKNHKIKDVG